MIFGCIEIALTNSTKILLSHDISPQLKPYAVCKMYSRLSWYVKHEMFCIAERYASVLFTLNSEFLAQHTSLRLLGSPKTNPRFIIERQQFCECVNVKQK